MCSNQSPLAAWRGSRLDWAAFRDGFAGRAAIFLHLRSSSLASPTFRFSPSLLAWCPAGFPGTGFWTVFFGVAFISAGVSFATGFLQRWAALGVGLMFALWTVTIHLPSLLTAQDPDKWSDVFIVIALWGGFWGLVRDLRDRKI
jgi:uncharacterized membrane protein YphA (DoxX/SURF4 family)